MSIYGMCALAGVSRAGFYRHWEAVAPSEAEMALREAVQRAALAHRFYGYRRVQGEVQKAGYPVGYKVVRRILQEDNLLAIRRRQFRVTTDSQHTYRVYPNLAAQLELTDINQLWVADLTYLRLLAEFVFLAVVLDAFSRRAIGWALGRHLDSSLALQALNTAIDSRHRSRD
jgi:putative transposase